MTQALGYLGCIFYTIKIIIIIFIFFFFFAVDLMYARKRKYLGEWSEAAWIIHERSAGAYCLPLRWWLYRSRAHARLILYIYIIYFYNMCVCVWHEIHDTPNWEFARVSEENFYLLFYVTVAADETCDVRLLYDYDYYCKRTTAKPNIIVIYVSNTQPTVDIYYNNKLYRDKII